MQTLRETITPILSNRLHWHFTDHSVSHSDRVAALCERLAEPLAQSLNPTEAYVLYAACYTHDVGMHNERAGGFGRLKELVELDGFGWQDMPQEQRLDYLRRFHHQVSADMIEASCRHDNGGYDGPPIGLSLNQNDHPAWVAAVAESHAADTADPRYEVLVDQPTGQVRLRLLSALLRLADILDEAQHRAPEHQAKTLDMNDESKLHWWRHYYTREVDLNPTTSLVTIYYEFPRDNFDRYRTVVPELQMPWVRQEFERHRAALAENGLSWHVIDRPRTLPFDTLETMPEAVYLRMLGQLGDRRAEEASDTRRAADRHAEELRQRLHDEHRALHERRQETGDDDYLKRATTFARDLNIAGGALTASANLRGAIFTTTKNDGDASNATHVAAATLLAEILLRRGDARDAAMAVRGAEDAAAALPDGEDVKAFFYVTGAKAYSRAGSFPPGQEAAEKARALLPNSAMRDEVEAELSEARMLEGLDDEEVNQ